MKHYQRIVATLLVITTLREGSNRKGYTISHCVKKI